MFWEWKMLFMRSLVLIKIINFCEFRLCCVEEVIDFLHGIL
jgi:hypothetical protein